MWISGTANQLTIGQRVVRPEGIKKVKHVEPMLPIGLAETKVVWEGGQVERFCNSKALLLEKLE